MYEVANLFPSVVYREDLEADDITKLACELTYKFQEETESPVLVSSEWDKQRRSSDREEQKKYGFTSFADNDRLFHDDAWHPVADLILDTCRRMISATNKRLAEAAYLDSMWTTVYPNGCYVPEHTHPNCVYSGVFYAQAEKGAGDLEFRDPAWTLKSMCFPKEIGQIHETRRREPVKTGRLFMFPGWLPHATIPSQSEEDRIIIGFNLGF